MSPLERLLSHLNQVQKNGTGWTALCPSHEDNKSSLSIRETDDGKVLLKCFAECETAQIVSSLGLRMADLFPKTDKGPQRRKVVATYDYHNLSGELLFQTIRYDPKDFRQRRPNGNGGWIWNLNGIEPVLYHLPEMLQAMQLGRMVCIVEGEKDADALRKLGFVATCNPMGAGKWRQSYSETLCDAHVAILRDNDEPGRKHALQVAQALHGIGASIRIVDLPDLPDKGDVSDWIAAGGTKKKLEALIEATSLWEPQADADQQQNGQGDDRQWRQNLSLKKDENPHSTIANVNLILVNHEYWQGRLWFDAVRYTPMVDDEELSDNLVMNACEWLGLHEGIHLSSPKMVQQCMVSECSRNPRDLLKEWLDALPPWDDVERLPYWLHDIAGAKRDEYGMAVSRTIPLSMVARALDPGCMYRYVVILEGPENSGKTSLVRALAGIDWYVEFTVGLESKEALMLLRGAWVAEMAELDSLSRTEETRLKAFITSRQDTWIPKYSNNKVTIPRRTVFIGTTNDECYLKGQTGNTRFLPIETGDSIDVQAFLEMREQIFAEALHVYRQDRVGWWRFNREAQDQAIEEREARRIVNVYEDTLGQWLSKPVGGPQFQGETSWEEIAENFLHLEPAGWKDKGLQMQIAGALKTLGWKRQQGRNSKRKPGEKYRYWIDPT